VTLTSNIGGVFEINSTAVIFNLDRNMALEIINGQTRCEMRGRGGKGVGGVGRTATPSYRQPRAVMSRLQGHTLQLSARCIV